MNDDDLLQYLRRLEIELHQRLVRSHGNRLDELLHDSFLEVGKSGVTLDKADILALLPAESLSIRIWSEDYELSELADGVALLTYKAAYADELGELSKRKRSFQDVVDLRHVT